MPRPDSTTRKSRELYLQTYLRMIDYPAASTVLLVTVAMVMAVDFASARLRARLV